MSAKKIWFVSIRFDQQVHAQALGFTYTFYNYAWGVNQPEAEIMTKLHFEKAYPPVKVVEAKARLALQQDIRRYYFPEQFAGNP